MVFSGSRNGRSGSGCHSDNAQVSKEAGALTIIVFTKPFAFEGNKTLNGCSRRRNRKFKDKVDTLFYSKSKNLDVVDKKLSLLEAFKVTDSVLTQGVQNFRSYNNAKGLINVDFADVRLLCQRRVCLNGIGTGVGENRAQAAAIGNCISAA